MVLKTNHLTTKLHCRAMVANPWSMISERLATAAIKDNGLRSSRKTEIRVLPSKEASEKIAVMCFCVCELLKAVVEIMIYSLFLNSCLAVLTPSTPLSQMSFLELVALIDHSMSCHQGDFAS